MMHEHVSRKYSKNAQGLATGKEANLARLGVYSAIL
jgi:hypothetical protein